MKDCYANIRLLAIEIVGPYGLQVRIYYFYFSSIPFVSYILIAIFQNFIMNSNFIAIHSSNVFTNVFKYYLYKDCVYLDMNLK